MGLDEDDTGIVLRSRSSRSVALGTVIIGRAGGPDLGPGRAQARHLGELRDRRRRAGDRGDRARACRSPFVGALLYGISAGIFLAVDWALMTDIIPKASSGRYMGLSNVATASAGVLPSPSAGR